ESKRACEKKGLVEVREMEPMTANAIDPAAVATAERQTLSPLSERRMRRLLDGLCDGTPLTILCGAREWASPTRRDTRSSPPSATAGSRLEIARGSRAAAGRRRVSTCGSCAR